MSSPTLQDCVQNPFTLSHGFLTDCCFENVPKNASFSQATGSIWDIKQFLENDCEIKSDCNILYTSTLNIAVQDFFGTLSDKHENMAKIVNGNLKFNFTGNGMTENDFKVLFESHNLIYSSLV